jgi:mono/diheme cytochrome c family protein
MAVGRMAFNQACARCHGADGDGSRAPAPDLRRLSRHCGALNPGAWRDRCLADADAYFLKSVRFGKHKFGIEHMPAWEGVLTAETVWSIRTFIENAPRP